MPKPSTTFTWATDPAYVGGLENGLPPRFKPPDSLNVEGWQAGDLPAARHANFMFGVAGDWIHYLDNLFEDPDFVDANFDWEGDHSYAAAWLAQGPAVFADLRTSQNLELTGTSEVLWANPIGTAPQRAVRTKMINLAAGSVAKLPNTVSSAAAELVDEVIDASNSQMYWQMLVDGGRLVFPLEVPTGSEATLLRFGFRNETTGAETFRVALFANQVNKETPGPAGVYWYSSPAPSSSIAQKTSFVYQLTIPPGFVMSREFDWWDIWVEGSSSLQLWWIEVVYLDPGPRNF